MQVLRRQVRLIVDFDENHREEDDVANDDQNQGNPSPLQLQDSSNATVCLARRDGADTGCIRRQVGTVGAGIGGVKDGLHVDMDTVSHCSELQDQRCSGESRDRRPVILGPVLDVDMAHIAKAEGYPGQDEHDRYADTRNTPTADESPPHELVAEDHFPADLEMKCKGTDKTCDD